MKKIKNNMMSFITSIITILIPVMIGVVIWDKLPEKMALRFDFEGNPASYYPKGFAVFGIYLFILIMHLFVSFATASENDKGEGIPDKLYVFFLWIAPIVSILVAALVYSNALGYKVDAAFWELLVFGALYLILGNYAPKLRMNQFAGVRVKWTFESKKNWEHTNRFSGWVMCILGMVFIMMALTKFYNTATAYWMPVVLFILLIVPVGVMILYSFIYYKKHREDDDYYSK